MNKHLVLLDGRIDLSANDCVSIIMLFLLLFILLVIWFLDGPVREVVEVVEVEVDIKPEQRACMEDVPSDFLV